MEKEKMTIKTRLLLIIAAIGALPWAGFVLFKMWNWFIPQIGLNEITYGGSFGILLVAALFKKPVSVDAEDPIELTVKMYLGPAILFLFGVWLNAVI